MFRWIELECIELNWHGMDWVDLNWNELSWNGLSWIELNSIELSWIVDRGSFVQFEVRVELKKPLLKCPTRENGGHVLHWYTVYIPIVLICPPQLHVVWDLLRDSIFPTTWLPPEASDVWLLFPQTDTKRARCKWSTDGPPKNAIFKPNMSLTSTR